MNSLSLIPPPLTLEPPSSWSPAPDGGRLCAGSPPGLPPRVVASIVPWKLSQESGRPVFALEPLSEDTGAVSMLLVDSGSFDHVCPLTFGAEYPLDPVPGGCQPVVGAGTDGELIPCYGVRKVPFQFGSGRLAVCRFQVAEVRRPILAVSALVEQGFHFILEHVSWSQWQFGAVNK